MTRTEAKNIVNEYTNTTDDQWADYTHRGSIDAYIATHAALAFLETDGSDEDRDFVENFWSRDPVLGNYDFNGNWLGSVANENGWVA